jgi:hypothetical protein
MPREGTAEEIDEGEAGGIGGGRKECCSRKCRGRELPRKLMREKAGGIGEGRKECWKMPSKLMRGRGRMDRGRSGRMIRMMENAEAGIAEQIDG